MGTAILNQVQFLSAVRSSYPDGLTPCEALAAIGVEVNAGNRRKASMKLSRLADQGYLVKSGLGVGAVYTYIPSEGDRS